MRDLIAKFVGFVGISGVGWIIDFALYTLLTHLFRLPVLLSNCISTVPAITLVFFLSTRKLFVCRPDGLQLRTKYILYALYQLVLVVLVSAVTQYLANGLPLLLPSFAPFAKLAAKVLITPVTMICNFFVLRYITEKW